tara:strand:+ start:148 stop:390 length:243 start_codon:yes stop_codon:yes gene_type:complete
MWISFLVNIKRPKRNVQKTLPGRYTHIPFKQGRANAFQRQLVFVSPATGDGGGAYHRMCDHLAPTTTGLAMNLLRKVADV